MTEYCYQTTSKTKNFYKLSNEFNIIFSLILSNPIYFCYLIFFSPYIFKLLSFLSPLFFTTSLIFLSLLTTLFPLHSKETFFPTAYNTLLQFKDGISLPTIVLEELEVYKIFFEISTIDQNPVHNEAFEECPVDEKVIETTNDGNANSRYESLTMEEHEKVCTKPKEVKVVEEEIQKVVNKQELSVKRWESNVIEGYKTTQYPPQKAKSFESKMYAASPKTPSSREEEQQEGVVKQVIKRWESNVIEGYRTPKNGENFSGEISQKVGQQPYMGSFGSSMRKEKEWRRTLACKLFEERHNINNKNDKNNNNTSVNEEGMDLLWETYETESIKGKSKEKQSKKGKKKDARIEELMKVKNDNYDNDNDNNKGWKKDTRIGELMKMKNDDDYEYNEDVDDNVNGKFCCLQALKLSAGKMNLSMGMKFSKAFKGIGMLQSHVRKQGRKGYK